MVDSDKVYDKLYLSIRLINVIRKGLSKIDPTLTDQDVSLDPIYNYIGDLEYISGCKVASKSKNRIWEIEFGKDSINY